MGIALSGLDGLTAPLRSVLGWLMRAGGTRGGVRHARAGNCGGSGLPATSCFRPAKLARPPAAAPGRPLRVVRVVDTSRPATGAGRMFISGRMADVCAELDRLAAMEAAAG